MRLHYSTLGDFVPASYTVPQNPVLALKSNGMGDFVPAWFSVPQNTVRDAMGLSGLGEPCWYYDDLASYDLMAQGLIRDGLQCIRGGYHTGARRALNGLGEPGCWYFDDRAPYDLLSQGAIRDGEECIRGGYRIDGLNGLGCGCGGGCGGKCGGMGAVDTSFSGTGIVSSLGSTLGITSLPAIPNWVVYGVVGLAILWPLTSNVNTGRRRRSR